MNTPKRVVIVGAGFAGLSAAKGLAGTDYEVTLVDRHNHHLFQPLLYQVATAALSPADIAAPIRSILRRQANARVILAEVTGLDLARREVIAEDRRIPYDILILATGARHAYFGHPEWAGVSAGPEDHRRRDLPAPPHPDRLREGRDGMRPRGAAPVAHVRRRRRRGHRGGGRRRDR